MRILADPVGCTAGAAVARPNSRALEALNSNTSFATNQISTQQLATLEEQVQAASRAAGQLVAGRDKAELSVRHTTNSWSVAECLDHLTQTANTFLPAISETVTQAPRLAKNQSLRTGILAQLVIRHLEPPYRVRVKALPQLMPKRTEFDNAWPAFLDSQSQFAETVRYSHGFAIDRVNITCPVYARLSYNAYGALRMLVAHERRHLWQIEQILARLDRIESRSA
jgi:hypothetical protein